MAEAGDRLRPAQRSQGIDSVPRLASPINWRYPLLYAEILSGITGLTLLQDLRSIDWFTIGLCVIMVTWWCRVTPSVLVLLVARTLRAPPQYGVPVPGDHLPLYRVHQVAGLHPLPIRRQSWFRGFSYVACSRGSLISW